MTIFSGRSTAIALGARAFKSSRTQNSSSPTSIMFSRLATPISSQKRRMASGVNPRRLSPEMVGIRGDGSRFPAEVAMGVLCGSSGVRIAKIMATAIVLLFGLTLLWLCVLWLDPVGLARAGFDARELAAKTFNFIYTERTQTLNWPVWALYMIMPVFALSMMVHSAANLLEDLEVVPRVSQAGFLRSSMEGLS